MAESLVELEKRLTRLERRAQVMFAAGMTALAAALLLVASQPGTAQGEAPVFKAPFRVVDAANSPVLEVSRDAGGSLLRLFGSEGRVAAQVTGGKDGGSFNVLNAEGKVVAEVQSRPEGAGRFLVRDKSEQPAGSLSARSNGAGGEFLIFNRTGKNAAALIARSDDSGGQLSVYNQTGAAVGTLLARPDNGGGDFGVYDKGGKVMAALLARPDGTGGDVAIYNRSGKLVGAISASGESGNLFVRDAAGRDLFAKP